MIQKTLAIKKFELENNLNDLLNASGLPLCLIECILSDTLSNTRLLAAKELENDLKKYKEALIESREVDKNAVSE